jgi:hypothetical protein
MGVPFFIVNFSLNKKSFPEGSRETGVRVRIIPQGLFIVP